MIGDSYEVGGVVDEFAEADSSKVKLPYLLPGYFSVNFLHSFNYLLSGCPVPTHHGTLSLSSVLRFFR